MKSRSARHLARSAFTLVEMIATVTVLGIIGAATLPVVEATGALYAESASMSRSVERASFAIDRLSRVLREVGVADDRSGLAIAQITPTSFVCTNGDGVSLDQDRLMMSLNGRSATLCDGVTEFEILALGADGLTRTESDPSTTRRVFVRLVCDGIEIRTTVFPRAAAGVLP